MRRRPVRSPALVFLAVVVSCSSPTPTPPPKTASNAVAETPAEPSTPEALPGDTGTGSDAPPGPGSTPGAGVGEESLSPRQLTGVPGIDRAQDLVVKILDARGTGRMGTVPLVPGKVAAVTPGQWMLTDPGSEYEITLRSSLVPDGIVRLSGNGAFLVEVPTGQPTPRFRLFGGTASFYLPDLPLGLTSVQTPAGRLVTRGAVFTVAVSPDFQVLVTCREGSVALVGTRNAIALPGQVLVADRLGRNRVYPMTPSEAQVFADHWLAVMTEGAATVLGATLPRRLVEWSAPGLRERPEEARFLALWFRQARTVLGPAAPGAEFWSWPLDEPIRPTVWKLPQSDPGLMGELP